MVTNQVNVVTQANMSLNILPRKLVRILRYAQTVTLTTGTSGVVGSTQYFRLNSIFDPWTTMGGNSAYGTSQLATWYTRYLVTHTKVKLVATTPGGTAEVSLVWKLDNTDGFVTLVGQSIDRCVEAPMIGTAFVGPSGNDRSLQVEFDVSPWQMLGVTRRQYIDEWSTYSALMTANPTVTPAIQIGAASFSGVAGESITVQVVIDFTTELSEPTQLAQSS